MSTSKSLLLFTALLSLAVGNVDCAQGQSYTVDFSKTASLPFESDQTDQADANEDPAAIAPPIHFAKNQSATPLTARLAGAVTSPSIQQASYEPTPALLTLGANDDLQSIVNNASGVVLVDFYADWCGPCRKQGGILHDMEQAASRSHATIIKINIDQHRQLASSFNVSSLPTLMLIKDGTVVERQTGLADHQRVASLLAR